jgi:D-alanyl-D-alanine-carboxypeptidase/D-alanyl-D-alanine-endopeptidase
MYAATCTSRSDRSADASHEVRSAAGTLEEERRIVANTAASMLSETPRRAIGVMLLDSRGPRFHTFGRRSTDGLAFDPDTTFEIGSVSKVFAGVLLADAEQRGEIELDDPITKHLPDWSLPARDGKRMTLRHAATHTTGLPLMPTNWVKTSGGTTHYTEQMLRENLATYPLESAPGKRYVYGNLNTALIGLALTRRTGQTYSALLQQRVFEPLAMRRSGYPDARARIDDNALDGFEEDESLSVPRLDVSPLGPCCVVRSTLRDMSRFAAAALEPKGPLSAAFGRAAEPQRAIEPSDIDSRWIGLGWEIDRRSGLLRKSGQVSGYRCELVLQPSEGRALFVLVNSMRARILDLSAGLMHGLWDPPFMRAPPPPPTR